MAYPGRGEAFPEGSYWFVDLSLRPHVLAVDTHTYWRLMLAHLGMPQWQALVAGQGLTPWARVSVPRESLHAVMIREKPFGEAFVCACFIDE